MYGEITPKSDITLSVTDELEQQMVFCPHLMS